MASTGVPGTSDRLVLVIVLVIVGVGMGVIVLVLGGRANTCDAAQRWFRLGRHLARRESVEQLVGRGRDGGDSALEGRSCCVRGFLDAAHLAHVLPRRGLDLLVSGNRLQAAKGRDVPAHASDGSRGSRRVVAGYAVTVNLTTVTLRVEPFESR